MSPLWRGIQHEHAQEPRRFRHLVRVRQAWPGFAPLQRLQRTLELNPAVQMGVDGNQGLAQWPCVK